jgi:hypothetical protein
MTPILQDVVMLVNLPIDGNPVTGPTAFNKDDLYHYLLGWVPPLKDIKGIILD